MKTADLFAVALDRIMTPQREVKLCEHCHEETALYGHISDDTVTYLCDACSHVLGLSREQGEDILYMAGVPDA
jgi:hypothetical protein